MINKILVISEETSIIISLIKSQEDSLNDFINNFENKINVNYEECVQQNYEGDPGELVQYPIEHYAGIDDRGYDIREIFQVVSPMYQRQAMLITIWAHLDHSLELMKLFLVEKKAIKIPKKGNISDFKHKIDLIIANTDSTYSDSFYENFNRLDSEVRLIRNQWVHHGGKKNNKLSLENIGLFEKYSQIVITSEYLQDSINMMKTVIEELVNSLNNI